MEFLVVFGLFSIQNVNLLRLKCDCSGHITHTSPRIPLDSSDVKHFDSSQERGSKASNHHPGECATNLALKGHNLNHGDSSIVENKEAERRPGSSIKTCSDVKSSTKFAESRYMPLKEKVCLQK